MATFCVRELRSVRTEKGYVDGRTTADDMVEYGLTKWNWGREPGCSPGKVLIRYKRLRERYYLIRSTWMPPPSSTADDDDGAEGEEVGDDVATTTTGENGDENETK